MSKSFLVALVFAFMPSAHAVEASAVQAPRGSDYEIWAHDVIEMALTGDQEGLLRRVSEESVYSALMGLKDNPDFAPVREKFLELARFNNETGVGDDRTRMGKMRWTSRVSAGDSNYFQFVQVGRFRMKADSVKGYLSSIILGPTEVMVRWTADCKNLSRKHFEDFFYNNREPRTLSPAFSEQTNCRMTRVLIGIKDGLEDYKTIELY